jgi:hypothetical protein
MLARLSQRCTVGSGKEMSEVGGVPCGLGSGQRKVKSKVRTDSKTGRALRDTVRSSYFMHR